MIHLNHVFLLETEMLQFRACVRVGDMFILLHREETVETGQEVLESVSELVT